MTNANQTSPTQRGRPRKQSVWFVRYGLTEHPLVEDLGPYDSDIDPSEGIDHAMSIAKRIATGLDGKGNSGSSSNDTTNADSIPAVVYASPFLRTAHTGYVIANELQQQTKQDTATIVELRLEEGLWEWLIPSLLVTQHDGIKTNPRPLEVLKEDLLKIEAERSSVVSTIATSYQSVNPYDDSGDIDAGIVCVPSRPAPTSSSSSSSNNNNSGGGKAPRWTESQDDLLARCETTLSGLLSNHQADGMSFCVVSHAPCDQAMTHYLEKEASKTGNSKPIETPKDSALEPWPLGGITVFSREILCNDDDDAIEYGNWTMDLYGDTNHMPGEYKAGLKEWSLPCFAK